MAGRVARWSTSLGGVLAGSLLVTVLVALVADLSLDLWHTSGNTGHVWRELTTELPIFLLNSLVIWLFVVLLVAVLGRLWLSVGITLAVTGLLGFVDQRKSALVTEPLYPSDLAFNADPGFLTKMVGIGTVLSVVAALLAVVAASALLGRRLGKHLRPPDRRSRPRAFWALIGLRVVVSVAMLSGIAYVTEFHQPGNDLKAAYDRYGAHWRPWHQTRNYTDNGVVAGLLYNLPVPAMAKPAGYSAATMRQIVEKYTAAAREINRTRDPHALDDVNVVSVLSEAFSDPTRFHRVKLAEDPIPFTRRLMGRTTSGYMLTEKYGGGTANVEFEVLTGMSTTQFRPQLSTPYTMLVPHYQEFPSAVRFFEHQGLDSTALHSFTSDLYRRAEVYPIFGFNHVAFQDDMAHRQRIDLSPLISDKATFEEVFARLRASSKPMFMNVVTMQNHYPAAGSYYNPIPVTGMTDAGERANLSHYARGISYSDSALRELLDSLEHSDEKTVVVLYGDHLPPVWEGTGMPPRMKHETPFLVWANFGVNRPDPRPTTSPIYLMNHVLERADAPVSPYYALLGALEQQVPAMSPDYYVNPQDVSTPWDQLSPAAREVLRDYRLVEYDLSVGARYSEDAMLDVPDGAPGEDVTRANSTPPSSSAPRLISRTSRG